MPDFNPTPVDRFDPTAHPLYGLLVTAIDVDERSLLDRPVPAWCQAFDPDRQDVDPSEYVRRVVARSTEAASSAREMARVVFGAGLESVPPGDEYVGIGGMLVSDSIRLEFDVDHERLVDGMPKFVPTANAWFQGGDTFRRVLGAMCFSHAELLNKGLRIDRPSTIEGPLLLERFALIPVPLKGAT